MMSDNSAQVCHEAMEIEWGPVEAKARELGIMVTRVAVKDFDRLDQVSAALRLPGSHLWVA